MDNNWKEVNKLLTIRMGYCAINTLENRNCPNNMFSNLKNEKNM